MSHCLSLKEEFEESENGSCSVTGKCRCPVWWGQAPEAGDICPDCFQDRTQNKYEDPRGPNKPHAQCDLADGFESETSEQEHDNRPGDTKRQPDFPDVPNTIWGGCLSRGDV